MSSGNAVTVNVSTPSPVTVTVPGSVGSSPTITNGGTANVTVTSVGDRGPKGDVGPATTLSIGQVATGAAGSSAAATLTGPSGAQVLSLTIPRGDAGAAGAAGAQGPQGQANSLSIGTVTTGAAGSSASATISGTAPSQTLSLSIPRGDTGATGSTGAAGANGSFSDAQAINARTSNYTLVLLDAGRLVTASHSTNPITITVPNSSSVAFPIGTHIDIARLGEAGVSVAGAAGVTVNATPGLNLRARYSSATLIEITDNSWLLVGDLTP